MSDPEPDDRALASAQSWVASRPEGARLIEAIADVRRALLREASEVELRWVVAAAAGVLAEDERA